MKRILVIIISVSMIIGSCIITSNAQNHTSIISDESLLVQYDDGSYITVTIGRSGNPNSRTVNIDTHLTCDVYGNLS